MAEKFQDKYRIQSSRLQSWDYGWSAYYFITICIDGHEQSFGKIKNNKIVLSKIGQIAKSEWLKTPEIRPDMNITLDEFVIMPDHFHAIIHIGKNKYNQSNRDAMHGVSTIKKHEALNNKDDVSKNERNPVSKQKNKFGPQRKNLASIIRGFKSAVTIKARKIDREFLWQSRFHEHIIKDKKSLIKIRNYIKYNPQNWNPEK